MKLTPALRLTIGMISLTLGLLLVADYLGLTPDGEKVVVDQRVHYAEMLSVQMSLAAKQGDAMAMQSILWSAVKRNPELTSAGVRRADSVLLVEFGDHQAQWESAGTEGNTATHMSLPIIYQSKSIGRLEIVFMPVRAPGLMGLLQGRFIGLVVFFLVCGSFAYWFLLKRSLQYLDPSAVVPDRVRSALDVLANGVLIIDEKEQIVLANTAFMNKCGEPGRSLIGLKPSNIDWEFLGSRDEPRRLPWLDALASGEEISGVLLGLTAASGKKHIFIVNSVAISDDAGKPKGAMIGFDDVTDIEEKNAMLKSMLKELEVSKHEVEEQNKKLHVLATRDPLTNCFNRRAFNEQFDAALAEAKQNNTPISCFMTDIDHFKAVNDTHGHAAGDEIIKLVANVLNDNVRKDDVVGRYGGEEFCVMLPGIDAAAAHRIAERCRFQIESKVYDSIKVTNSFGISSVEFGSTDPEALINEADEALYRSKEGGRNRVTVWKELKESEPGKADSVDQIWSFNGVGSQEE